MSFTVRAQYLQLLITQPIFTRERSVWCKIGTFDTIANYCCVSFCCILGVLYDTAFPYVRWYNTPNRPCTSTLHIQKWFMTELLEMESEWKLILLKTRGLYSSNFTENSTRGTQVSGMQIYSRTTSAGVYGNLDTEWSVSL